MPQDTRLSLLFYTHTHPHNTSHKYEFILIILMNIPTLCDKVGNVNINIKVIKNQTQYHQNPY